MNKLILVCIVAAVVPVAIAATNKCFQCEYFSYDDESSKNVKECEENPPPDKYLVDCATTVENASLPTSWQCLKVTGRVEVDDENYNFVRRQCVPGNKAEVACKNTRSFQISHENFIKRGKQCYCDEKDGCNTGTGLQAGGIVALSATILVVTFLKF